MRTFTNSYRKQTNLNALLRSPKLFIFTSLSEAQKWKVVFISWRGIQPVPMPDSAISNEVLFISFIEDLTGRK